MQTALVAGLGAIFTAAATFFISRRVNSGQVTVTPAETLWREATKMREDLRTEMLSARAELDSARAELMSAREEAAALRREVAELRQHVDKLERELADYTGRGST